MFAEIVHYEKMLKRFKQPAPPNQDQSRLDKQGLPRRMSQFQEDKGMLMGLGYVLTCSVKIGRTYSCGPLPLISTYNPFMECNIPIYSKFITNKQTLLNPLVHRPLRLSERSSIASRSSCDLSHILQIVSLVISWFIIPMKTGVP